MAKRPLLMWMRDKLRRHAEEVVIPTKEKRVLDAAYAKAQGLVRAIVEKKFPPDAMKILEKFHVATAIEDPQLQFPNGVVTEFKFGESDMPLRPDTYEFNRQIFLADTKTAEAVEKWVTARDAYKAERSKRLTAYGALIDGAKFVEDISDMWPEVKGLLPAGSPPIPLGPEQIALVKADQRERKAA
jgi:hypothetical protein